MFFREINMFAIEKYFSQICFFIANRMLSLSELTNLLI